MKHGRGVQAAEPASDTARRREAQATLLPARPSHVPFFFFFFLRHNTRQHDAESGRRMPIRLIRSVSGATTDTGAN